MSKDDFFISGHPYTGIELRSVAMDVEFDVPDPHAGGFDGQIIGAVGLNRSRHKDRLLPWIGVMFYDTVQYHTAGRVQGEHLITIPLTPGEEITLTQRSETVSERQTQNEVTREFEVERGIEGTWSTDISDTLVSSTSMNLGGNLGLGAGGEVQAFTANANLGGTGGLQLSTQQTQVVNYGRELSRKMNARMRQNHRTLLSTGTTDRFERGITRVLRNDNPDRPVNYVFYKIYNKRRIVHQRNNAKLCYRNLLVDDTGAFIEHLNNALDAIDPENEQNWSHCEKPETVQDDTLERPQSTELEFFFPPPAGVLSILGGPPTSALVAEVNTTRSLSLTVTPPDNYGVADVDLEILAYTQKISNFSGSDVTEIEVEPPSQYLADGGALQKPMDGTTPGTVTITITATRPWWITDLRWAHSLKVKATPRFASIDDTQFETHRACIESVKLTLVSKLSPALVDNIISQGVRSFFGSAISDTRSVLNRTFENWSGNTARGYFDHVHGHFDWNEAIVELVPVPASPEAVQARRDLIARIHRLAPEVDAVSLIPEMHTATARIVWLPISLGSEDDVIERLAEPQGHFETDQMLNLWLRGYRFYRHQLGHPKSSRATANTLDSPVPLNATPTDATAWDHDWEKPVEGLVLDSWSDITPTDGVHVEGQLSDCGVMDDRASFRFQAELSEFGFKTER